MVPVILLNRAAVRMVRDLNAIGVYPLTGINPDFASVGDNGAFY
jgi:hypothetical protein